MTRMPRTRNLLGLQSSRLQSSRLQSSQEEKHRDSMMIEEN
jgi:hypothetical protein